MQRPPPELTHLQQARWGGWLLDHTRQLMVSRYASDKAAITQLLLPINMVIAAMEYTDEPDFLHSAPVGISEDPEVFINLAELFQSQIDAIYENGQGESLRMQPALGWLAESKRYATFCAARLREHHLANPPRRRAPKFDPNSATGTIPLDMIRHLLPKDVDNADPDNPSSPRRIYLSDLKTGKPSDSTESQAETGPADPPADKPNHPQSRNDHRPIRPDVFAAGTADRVPPSRPPASGKPAEKPRPHKDRGQIHRHHWIEPGDFPSRLLKSNRLHRKSQNMEWMLEVANINVYVTTLSRR